MIKILRNIHRKIIGFIQVLIGVLIPTWVIASFIFTDNIHFSLELKNIIRLPLAIMFFVGCIKYGWRWMFSLFDILDEEELKPDDVYYRQAKIKAQSNIELFLSYLRKEEFICQVLISVPPKNKPKWVMALTIDEENVIIKKFPTLISRILKKNNFDSVHKSKIEDWFVKVDDTAIGFYSVKALAQKAKDKGLILNRRSQKILSKIIT